MGGAKRALVVGGGTGLGFASAEAMAKRGAAIFLTGRRDGLLREAAGRLGNSCAGLMAGDATCEEDVSRVVEAASKALGSVDTLVVSAGATSIGSVLNEFMDGFRDSLDANLLPLFLFSKFVVPLLPEAGGSITVIASIAGTEPHPDRVAYCAAKAGVIGMARQMALDLAPRRIRVNSVSPSLVLTELSRGAIAGSEDPVATLAARLGRHPLGRLGTSEEIGVAIAYLASDDASWITGQDLRLDGGLSLRAASA